MKKRRADEVLYESHSLESMNLARALIMEGRVMAGDRKILSASEKIRDGEVLRVKGLLDPYVSRGAYKLKKALDVFMPVIKGKNCVDIGCSTGGFSDVMLRNGAEHVFSVDVGYNLLDYRIRSNPKVTAMEKTNARFLTVDSFDREIGFGATDVSFISLKMILPAVLPLIRGKDPSFIALIKPQFEAEKEEVGEKGVVTDPDIHKKVLKDILTFVPQTGWYTAGLDFSPIKGPEGNIEFLLYLLPGTEVNRYSPEDERFAKTIDDIIMASYDNISKSSK